MQDVLFQRLGYDKLKGLPVHVMIFLHSVEDSIAHFQLLPVLQWPEYTA